MPSSSCDSSSDDEEDNTYCNAAQRLKALKSQCNNKIRAPPPKKDTSPSKVSPLPEILKKLEAPRSTFQEKQQSAPNESLSLDKDSSAEDDVEFVSKSFDSRKPPKIPEFNNVTPNDIHDSPNCVQINLDEDEVVPEDSFSEIPTVDVYVRWKSNNIECLHLSKDEPLIKIFQYFADQENIPVNCILVSRKDTPIKPTDTPASLRLSIIDVLEGGVISADACKIQVDEADNDLDACKIKAQISLKKSLIFKLRKQEPFKKLAEYCAQELTVPINKVRLYFDGDHIGDDETPEDLDLDDEACIDVKIL